MEDIQPLGLLILLGIGLFAGTLNTLAGGGSLITLPALMFLGLPPAFANATNRVGVLVQSAIATLSLARAGKVQWAGVMPRLIAASAGALLGAKLATEIEPSVFRKVIAGVMLLMLVILLAQPKRWIHPRPSAPLILQLTAFFVIGVYGGFLQAGVGIFLLMGSALLSGEDLVQGNATKNLLVAVFTVPALGLFLYEGLVLPIPGLCLALGSMLGGWIGAHLALRLGAGFVRWVLVVVVAAAATKLLELW